MFKVNNKDTRTGSGVFNVNFEHISHLVLSDCIANSEHVNADWVSIVAQRKWNMLNMFI